jgi:hypothetical protein
MGVLELLFLFALIARIIAHTKEHYILMNIFHGRRINHRQNNTVDDTGYEYPGEARQLNHQQQQQLQLQEVIPVVLHV